MSASRQRRSGVRLMGALLLFACAAVSAGCGGTPTPPIPPSDSAKPRPPHKTFMMHIEFNSVVASEGSPELLKTAIKGLAEVENGPFLVPNQPFVRFAVSVPASAAVDPVLQKIRAVPAVKNVSIVR